MRPEGEEPTGVPDGAVEVAAGNRNALPDSRSNGGRALFGIREGEGWAAWLFFLYFFVLACAHYAVKSVRQATFIHSWGAEQLPWVYLLLAVLSLPVIVVYTRIAGRHRLYRTIIAFCVAHGLTLAAFFFLFRIPGKVVPIVFYVWSTVAFGIAVSQLWSYAGQVFDPRQAKRLFAFVGAGGLLGGIPGGLLARVASGRVGTHATLLVSALLFVGVAFVIWMIEKKRSLVPRPVPVANGERALREARGGLRTVLGSRLLENIALVMMLTMIAAQMVDLQFNWAIQAVTEDLDGRTAMFGGVYGAMGLVGFVFQLLFTGRIQRGLGVGFSMRVLPVTVIVSTLFLIVAVGVVPAAIVGAAWFLKLSEGGLRHSIDQATRELLFLPVAPDLRRRGKAFIDIFVQRFAKGVAALLLLPVSFGLFGMRHVAVMTLVVVGLWLVVTEVTRREYVRAFRRGLKAGGPGAPDPIDLEDAGTMAALVEGLGSSDVREVLHSMQLLAANGRGRLISPLLLHHGDPEVRRRVVAILAEEGRRDAVGLIERAMGDENSEVRGAAIRAVAALKREDAVSMMEDRLLDRDPAMRAAAVAFLLEFGGSEARVRSLGVLAEMAVDGSAEVRRAAAGVLGGLGEDVGRGRLVSLLYDPDRGVVREAIRAAKRRRERGDMGALSVPILISLMRDRRLKHDAREAIVAHGDRAIDALVLFMNSPDERMWVRRAIPKTMAVIGGERAKEALIRSLDLGDAFLRSKVIESLVSMRRKDPGLSCAAAPIQLQIREEARRYLVALVDLMTVSSMHQLAFDGPRPEWRRGGLVPTLLQQFLACRMRQGIENLFGLLELLYPPDDIRAAARSLSSGDPGLAARALEYLDNSLSGGIRRDVFAVIEDLSTEDKLRRAAQQYSIAARTPEEAMRANILLDLERDPGAVGSVAAAVYGVWQDRFEGLLPEVGRVTETSPSPLVRETAAWVTAKMNQRDAPQRRRRITPSDTEGAREANGENEMTAMTRIEMMIFLQGVDIFSYCDADQMLRLAAISNERLFEEGDTIYRRGMPSDALYCVIEGAVRLVTEEGREEEVVEGGRFGVREILGDRLRGADAVAVKPTRVLAIETDDFFDLLANNIEIVKALFRQATTVGLEPEGLR